LLPASYTWPPELDILETVGDQSNVAAMHVHWLANHTEAQAGSDWTGPDLSQDWHTFGLNWQPDALTWYIDGVERWRVTDSSVIPNQPMYIVLNLAVGGEWPGAPDSSTVFPSYFDVRYVRVWAGQN
jgi:beta-glucanase (GH16 family)